MEASKSFMFFNISILALPPKKATIFNLSLPIEDLAGYLYLANKNLYYETDDLTYLSTSKENDLLTGIFNIRNYSGCPIPNIIDDVDAVKSIEISGKVFTCDDPIIFGYMVTDIQYFEIIPITYINKLGKPKIDVAYYSKILKFIKEIKST